MATIVEMFNSVFAEYANIANAIRKKTGDTNKLSLNQMASQINSIPDNDSSDLTVSGANVTVPAGHYKAPASKSVEIAEQATPNISVDSSGLITASATQSAGYVPEGTKSATKQLTAQAGKTVTPSTSEQTVVPSGRFTTGDVKVAAMPAVAQATPSISIDSSGKITASATQSAGYVPAGTKSATKQMTTKGATTWTPKTSNQSIAAGTYLTGAQTIKGDSNLTAANIKKGVSIFGVSGSCEEYSDGLPVFTYTGEYTTKRDGSNWCIHFLTSGILKFTEIACDIDVFCCGGGGGGGSFAAGGGGGGYTTNAYRLSVEKNKEYEVIIGSGGNGGAKSDGGSEKYYSGSQGGASSVFGVVARGGYGGGGGGSYDGARYSKGGDGGSGGGHGDGWSPTDGASDGASVSGSGTGQGRTTKAFEDASSTELYGSGGGGGASQSTTQAGYPGSLAGGGKGGRQSGHTGHSANANTGGGGGGAGTWGYVGGNGGSGIVMIRNAR